MKVTRHVVKLLGSPIPSLLFKPVSPLPSAMDMFAAMCDVCMSHTHFLFVKLVQEFSIKLVVVLEVSTKNCLSKSLFCELLSSKRKAIYASQKKYINVYNFLILVFPPLFLVQCVPLATEPGISLIILTPMKILQRNLNTSTFVV